MHASIAFFIPFLVIAQSACALVVPSKHQHAHHLRKWSLRQHQHCQQQTTSDRFPKIIKIGSKQAEKAKSVATHKPEDGVTINFEAVPSYPETGAEDYRVHLSLARGKPTAIAVPKLAYSIRIEEAVDYVDAVCVLTVKLDELSESTRQWPAAETTVTFAKRDGMVALPRSMRKSLETGKATSSLACAVPGAELK